jgi:cell division septal protein FtsQ
VKEQVVTPRAGRAKGRDEQQRPAARRGKAATPAKSRGPAWRSALAYLPLALKAALAVVLGVMVFAAYRSAASASFFAVRSVDVEGVRRASREDIREAARAMARGGVFRADLELIAKELRELPWVRDAVVSRVLPSGLRVRVTEREPRVVARTSAGRLVWADDDGVVLGAATPDEDEFFVRGLEEEAGDGALRRNRERVALALSLAREWREAGLASRVSEVNLADLRDIRVQLAGQDSKVEVRLGDSPENFPKAVAELDSKRGEPFGELIEYVNASKALKRIVIGYPAWVNAAAVVGASADDGAVGETGAKRPEADAAPKKPARTAAPKPEKPAGRADARGARREAEKKKREAAGGADVASRPRRVG